MSNFETLIKKRALAVELVLSKLFEESQYAAIIGLSPRPGVLP